MLGILPFLTELLKMGNNISDPDKRRKAYELILDKKAYKALEAAEKVFLAYESWQAEKLSDRQWNYIYSKNKKIFFEND